VNRTKYWNIGASFPLTFDASKVAEPVPQGVAVVARCNFYNGQNVHVKIFFIFPVQLFQHKNPQKLRENLILTLVSFLKI
jgi:hypothetical protein